MLESIQGLGRATLGSLEKLGRANLFLLRMLAGLPDTVRRFGLLVAQVYSVGVLSILIISVSGLFVGMVISLQGYYVLSDFGAEQTLGVMVAASLVR